MRDRLHKNRRGFTLMETLLVITVLVILLAVSAVGVLTYLRQARITELDNAAREIYLAAQNRAILLQGSQRLSGQVTGNGTVIKDVPLLPDDEDSDPVDVYWIHSKAGDIADLLPAEIIEPALWGGDFYITYEPESASVVDVFFSWDELPVGENFADFYKEWRGRSRTARMENDPMIGYYGSMSGSGGNTISLSPPGINFDNDDILSVDVSYQIPILLYIQDLDNVSLNVTLKYGGRTLTLDLSDAVGMKEDAAIGDNGQAIRRFTYTWVLEDPLSLSDPDGVQYGKHFYELFDGADLIFGGAVSVTAEVRYDGREFEVLPTQNTVSDNSLFARAPENGAADTAYIGCLRHLQNLDADFSRVTEDITRAVQTNLISGVPTDYEGVAGSYTFRPIENKNLVSYDGGGMSGTEKFTITDLTVAPESGGADAGLFASAPGTLSNIRLVNTKVTAAAGGSAGALAAEASNVTIDNCLVYWEGTLGPLLTQTDENGGTVYLYQITGGTAGGLVGVLTDSTVTNSAAATLAEGVTVGGLAGTAENVTVTDSYADCYLSGAKIGGLFGAVSGNSSVTNAYAAGFIAASEGAVSDGLYNGGAVTAESVYSAVSGSVTGGYRLFDKDGQAVSADVRAILTDAGEWTKYLNTAAFVSKTAAQSHPYNLGDLALTVYDLPGLTGMDHYGDWAADFVAGTLVYYEQYEGGSYGFMGGNVNCLQDGRLPVSDGYAMVYDGDDPITDLTVRYTELNNGQPVQTEAAVGTGSAIRDVSVTINGTAETVILLPLPAAVVNVDYATELFYQIVTVGETAYYCNPHFAMIPFERADSSEEYPEFTEDVSVRTPRHLYHLSRQTVYQGHADQQDVGENYDFDFVQMRDLDYTVYTGAVNADGSGFSNAGGMYLQSPIGTQEDPFRGSYDGGSHVIRGVAADGRDGAPHVGLFGYSSALLSNIVLEMSGTASVTAEGAGTVRYLGAMVGTNAGTVSNCAVYGAEGTSFQATASGSAVLYLGGLAGQNLGVIYASAAENVFLTAATVFADAWAGGLVGRNVAPARVSQSYAVGWLAASQGQGTDSLTIAGFSGDGGGEVSRCYAAVSLENQRGEPVISGFSPTASTECFYLSNGNFTYRGRGYAALYGSGETSGTAVNWDRLTGADSGTDLAGTLGMGRGAAAVTAGGTYPFPAALTAAGKYVHYGLWPELLPMGGMGVFYWEALDTLNEDGAPAGTPTYHLSAIAADLAAGTVSKVGTLVTAHDDNRVVTDYGYGWYHTSDGASGGVNAALISSGISWNRSDTSQTGDFDPDAAGRDKTAEAAFRALRSDYEFYCYPTIDPESGDGLHRTAERRQYNIGGRVNSDKDGSEKPEDEPNVLDFAGDGSWVLTATYQGTPYTLAVDIDPFFADAVVWDEANSDRLMQTEEQTVPTGRLGSSEDSAYEIRSIDQLQFINWNVDQKRTNVVLSDSVKDQFPYLSCTVQNRYWAHDHTGIIWREYYWELREENSETMYSREYFWLQTHDIRGETGETYSPIAELYDTTDPGVLGRNRGSIHSWFGGTYDGDSYMIEDVNIQGGNSSCAGLFGVVFNGTLKNIILYSENGATVQSRTNSNDSVWYAMGGLAGMAVTNSGSAIENCAVAGYRIIDGHTGGETWGGTSLGGLIGVSSMDFTGCTAVTQVTYAAEDDDNERVGGLVGSCQGTITNCYAGGTIVVTGSSGYYLTHGIYVGGLAGGTYMKSFSIPGHYDFGGNGKSRFINCYSYVQLPDKGSNRYISNLYAVAGPGDGSGSTSHDNCYYLREIVLANNPEGDITPQSGITPADYESLSEGGAAYESLTQNGYSGVTALNGRYSFPSPDPFAEGTADPGYMDRYNGLDYPFPAVLTQDSELTDSGTAYVHYGWWPIEGIVRDEGSGPITLDLFADQDGEQVRLSLSDDLNTPAGGSWTVAGGDGVVETRWTNTGSATENTLTITPLAPGETDLTVSCGSYDPIEIHVVVTADLSLRPENGDAIEIFPGESLQDLLLEWTYYTEDARQAPLSEALAENIEVRGGFSASPGLGLATAFAQIDGTGQPVLHITAEACEEAADSNVVLSFRFTYSGSAEQTANAVIPVTVLPAALDEPEITISGGGTHTVGGITANDTVIQKVEVRSAVPVGAGVTVTRSGNDLTFTVDEDYNLQQAVVLVEVEFRYGGEKRTAELPLTVNIQQTT